MHSLDYLGCNLKLSQSSINNDYLSFYEKEITARYREKFKILIITNNRGIEIANMYADKFPNSEVTLANYNEDINSISYLGKIKNISFRKIEELLSFDGFGLVDIVIEHSSNKKSHKIGIFNKLFFQITPGGIYFIEELHAKYIPGLIDIKGDDILDIINKAGQIKIAPTQVRKEICPDILAIADCCESILVRGKLGMLVKKASTMIGLNNSRNIDLINNKMLNGEIIYKNNESFYFTHKNISIGNLVKNLSRHPDKFEIPGSYITKYDDVFCQPGQVICKGGFVLSDSFRIQHHKRLSNRNIIPIKNNLFIVKDTETPSIKISGEYFYLDSEYPCHFGHFTSEVISRLWAWEILRKTNPNLKVLIGLEKDKELPIFIIQILSSFNIKREDIVTFDGNVRVEMIYTATPYYVIGGFINPGILPVWQKIGNSTNNGKSGIIGKKLFISRPTGGNRKCLNPEKLETIFRNKGFEFYNPENHSWIDQVKTFSSAEIIAGYAGSGTFNAMFSSEIKKMIIIGSDSYTASNEHYICAIKNIDLFYFWGDSLLNHDNGWSPKAFMSDYYFNYERDEAKLIESI